MDNSQYQPIIIAAGMSKRLAELTANKPKSFLEIQNKRIIDYHLDILNSNGFRQATIVVGYLREQFFQTIGSRHKNLAIDYVVSEEFASTGHAWSVYLTRTAWQREKRPVLLIHADVFYDPRLLEKMMVCPYDNVTLVDKAFKVLTGDECIVRGQNGLVSSLLFDSTTAPKIIIGEFVGISKWSAPFLDGFYTHLEQFFTRAGRNVSYEVVLDEFIQKEKRLLYSLETNGLAWLNINYREDYERARDKLYSQIYKSS